MGEDRVSAELSAVDSLLAAIKLANEMNVAIVVMDPDVVWKDNWGELFTPADD